MIKGEKGRFRLGLCPLCEGTSKRGAHEGLGGEALHFSR